MPESQKWIGYLPFLIFALVMIWRFRSINRARPLRVTRLWVMPVVLLIAVGVALFGMHPSLTGWLVFAGGLVIGAALGAQRGRLMRLHVEGEGEDAKVMVRQSMAALLLILGVFAMRRLFLPTGGDPSLHGHPTGSALWITDGMLGFAVGVICLQRGVLWLRARKLVSEHRQGLGS